MVSLSKLVIATMAIAIAHVSATAAAVLPVAGGPPPKLRLLARRGAAVATSATVEVEQRDATVRSDAGGVEVVRSFFWPIFMKPPKAVTDIAGNAPPKPRLLARQDAAKLLSATGTLGGAGDLNVAGIVEGSGNLGSAGNVGSAGDAPPLPDASDVPDSVS
jgi:hypothetical protein